MNDPQQADYSINSIPSKEPHQSQIDFRSIAQQAINSGLFSRDTKTIALNQQIQSKSQQHPEVLLEIPYTNGPSAILQEGESLQQDAIDQVRKNFVQANHLLLPLSELLAFFDESLICNDYLRFGLREDLNTLYIPAIIGYSTTRYQSPRYSFNADPSERI